MVHAVAITSCIGSLKGTMVREIIPETRRNLVFKINGKETFLSAASGLVRTDSKVYIIADNELQIGILDLQKGTAVLKSILPGVLPVDEKARKKEKPDFESLFAISDESLPSPGLVAFPSGSTEKRFTGVFIPTDSDGSVMIESVVRFDLSQLFNPLIEKFGAVNIEGSLIEGDRLVLIHRGNSEGHTNRIFDFRKSDLINLITGKSDSESLELLKSESIEIGTLEGVKLTITDINLFEGRRFFIAAAEDTSNPIDDGKVMGTVFGELSPDGSFKIYGKLGLQKAEGLSLHRFGQMVEVSLVTDNDDPHHPSELLEFQIHLP